MQFQEMMIAERENEIREIEEGIHELNTIFRDLGTIVVEQGGMLGEYLETAVSRMEPRYNNRLFFNAILNRQHRVQHQQRSAEHFLGCRRTYHRTRVPTEGRTSHALPDVDSGCRACCCSHCCEC
jgi:hypothetical protein